LWLSRLGGQENAERVIEIGFLGGVGENGPGVGDEPEGLIGESEAVPFRTEEDGEPAELSSDELEALSRLDELEDGVPVGLAIGDPGLSGD
jgi:hypothetical protein